MWQPNPDLSCLSQNFWISGFNIIHQVDCILWRLSGNVPAFIFSNVWPHSKRFPLPYPSHSYLAHHQNTSLVSGMSIILMPERGAPPPTSFFKLNPRQKFAKFQDFSPPAHFRVRNVPDPEVFLAVRDTSYCTISSFNNAVNDKSAPQKAEIKMLKTFSCRIKKRPHVEDQKQSEKL